MDPYVAWVIVNCIVCVCVVLVALFTDSPWALLGLFFLFNAKID